MASSLRKLLQALIAVGSIAIACLPLSASAIVLQTANNVDGNQNDYGVGVRFTVVNTIGVTALGIYDADPAGITGPLYATLFRQSDASVIVTMTFTAADGPAVGHYIFKTLDVPIVLASGEDYVLAGYGWTGSDPEHNSNIGGTPETFTTSTLVSYVNAPYGTQGSQNAFTTMPTNTFGLTNFFSAANMEFAGLTPEGQGVIPEPATLALLGLGLAGLGFRRRKLLA